MTVSGETNLITRYKYMLMQKDRMPRGGQGEITGSFAYLLDQIRPTSQNLTPQTRCGINTVHSPRIRSGVTRRHNDANVVLVVSQLYKDAASIAAQ